MRSDIVILIVIGVMLLTIVGAIADEPKPLDFTQVVIRQAIDYMPNDIKAKMRPHEKEIVVSAKQILTPREGSKKPHYFVASGRGNAPEMLDEQMRLARLWVKEDASYSALSLVLGRIAGTVISICQPYHTDESAFNSERHPAFERELDAAAGSLKAKAQDRRKIDKASDFAIETAMRSNLQLVKINSSNSDITEIRNSIFSLAAASVADCWRNLLLENTPQTTTAQTAQEEDARVETPAETGNYIGNKRSMKFHLPTCRYQPALRNQVPFNTREEAIRERYVPCKVCKP